MSGLLPVDHSPSPHTASRPLPSFPGSSPRVKRRKFYATDSTMDTPTRVGAIFLPGVHSGEHGEQMCKYLLKGSALRSSGHPQHRYHPRICAKYKKSSRSSFAGIVPLVRRKIFPDKPFRSDTSDTSGDESDSSTEDCSLGSECTEAGIKSSNSYSLTSDQIHGSTPVQQLGFFARFFLTLGPVSFKNFLGFILLVFLLGSVLLDCCGSPDLLNAGAGLFPSVSGEASIPNRFSTFKDLITNKRLIPKYVPGSSQYEAMTPLNVFPEVGRTFAPSGGIFTPTVQTPMSHTTTEPSIRLEPESAILTGDTLVSDSITTAGNTFNTESVMTTGNPILLASIQTSGNTFISESTTVPSPIDEETSSFAGNVTVRTTTEEGVISKDEASSIYIEVVITVVVIIILALVSLCLYKIYTRFHLSSADVGTPAGITTAGQPIVTQPRIDGVRCRSGFHFNRAHGHGVTLEQVMMMRGDRRVCNRCHTDATKVLRDHYIAAHNLRLLNECQRIMAQYMKIFSCPPLTVEDRDLVGHTLMSARQFFLGLVAAERVDSLQKFGEESARLGQMASAILQTNLPEDDQGDLYLSANSSFTDDTTSLGATGTVSDAQLGSSSGSTITVVPGSVASAILQTDISAEDQGDLDMSISRSFTDNITSLSATGSVSDAQLGSSSGSTITVVSGAAAASVNVPGYAAASGPTVIDLTGLSNNSTAINKGGSKFTVGSMVGYLHERMGGGQ